MTPHPSSPGVAGFIMLPLVVVVVLVVGPVVSVPLHPQEKAIVVIKIINIVRLIFILSSLSTLMTINLLIIFVKVFYPPLRIKHLDNIDSNSKIFIVKFMEEYLEYGESRT